MQNEAARGIATQPPRNQQKLTGGRSELQLMSKSYGDQTGRTTVTGNEEPTANGRVTVSKTVPTGKRLLCISCEQSWSANDNAALPPLGWWQCRTCGGWLCPRCGNEGHG